MNEEILEYIKEIAFGRRVDEIAKMTNEKFGTDYTPDKMAYIKKKYKIHSGPIKGCKLDKEYGEEFEKFIRENIKGKTVDEMAKMINERFGIKLTPNQVRVYKKKHGIVSGLDCRFSVGHSPWSKGRKMPYGWGGDTRFKPGSVPHNHREIGFETINKDGYIVVKVQEEGTQRQRWKFKHLIEWEKHNGPVPKGYMVIFLDGNKLNCDIENLAMISRQEHIEMVRLKLRFDDPELTKLGVNISRVNRKIKDRKKAKE